MVGHLERADREAVDPALLAEALQPRLKHVRVGIAGEQAARPVVLGEEGDRAPVRRGLVGLELGRRERVDVQARSEQVRDPAFARLLV